MPLSCFNGASTAERQQPGKALPLLEFATPIRNNSDSSRNVADDAG